MQNLYTRLDRMSQLEPLFMDLTWGAGGSTADLTLEISGAAQQMCSAEVMMHLTCTNMPTQQIREALDKAKQLGIRNILALRGGNRTSLQHTLQPQWLMLLCSVLQHVFHCSLLTKCYLALFLCCCADPPQGQ